MDKLEWTSCLKSSLLGNLRAMLLGLKVALASGLVMGNGWEPKTKLLSHHVRDGLVV